MTRSPLTAKIPIRCWKPCGALPALLLSACAGYHARPLDSAPPPAQSVMQLTVDASTLPLPALRAHRFDPGDGLDRIEVAMLAVARSPDLALLRDDLGIQRAQAFSAGLLPDPQVAFNQDFPTGGAADASTAFALGFTQDVTALLFRSSTVEAERLDTHVVELNLLWSEWQVVAQAYGLFDRVRADEALQQYLQKALPDYESLYRHIEEASAKGNLSADLSDGPLLAVADLKRQIVETQQRLNQEQHDLRALLGLGEQAPLPLVDGPAPESGTPAIPDDLDLRLSSLPQRRPDLLALQTGYRAEEQRVRLAVLQQFPAITAGFNRARDNSHISSMGYSIGVTLPIFNRGRGAIAIETATRQRLFDEYQSRLAAARSDIDRLRTDLPMVRQQLIDSRREAVLLRGHQAAAARAFASGRLDWNTFLTLTTAALNKEIESVQLALTLSEQDELLTTLLGSELPAGT